MIFVYYKQTTNIMKNLINKKIVYRAIKYSKVIEVEGVINDIEEVRDLIEIDIKKSDGFLNIIQISPNILKTLLENGIYKDDSISSISRFLYIKILEHEVEQISEPVEKQFTVADGIEVQTENLLEWKSILKPDVYETVEQWTKEKNSEAKNGYGIVRGSTISTYISNLARLTYLTEKVQNQQKI